ncbi:hypothetical protein BDA99DRAFT_554466 [Phascolomyces articulosus]|uniref:Uncharacterized protein n=1 Tax=Phascolomyces articulosus TaxID=60185 RepID=A0AAD5PJK6_9FUNG|nr:hypothetical protein BDA99DRAFT_554466 [Phascolomyces articulosus]
MSWIVIGDGPVMQRIFGKTVAIIVTAAATITVFSSNSSSNINYTSGLNYSRSSNSDCGVDMNNSDGKPK